MAKSVAILAGATEAAWLADQVRAGGGWIVATASPDDNASLPAADVIVADLRGLAEGTASEFLTRLSAGGICLVMIDAAAIDAAAPYLDDILLLADPDPADVAIAIALALGSVGQDAVADRDAPPDLRALSEEAGRIARALAALAETASPPAHPPLPLASAPQPSAAAVRAHIRRRRLRERFFAAEIFADPAWDILLDLYAARLEGGQVAVSSLCIAAAVPPTTALRWIRALTLQGLLVRIADPFDRRRIFVALGDGAAERMHAYFAQTEG